MGFYVNPSNCSKEAWLINNGIEVLDRTLDWDAVPAGCLPVVLINNGPFTAACIAYDPRELASATDPKDRRQRTIFIVEIKDLVTVGGSDFRRHCVQSGLIVN